MSQLVLFFWTTAVVVALVAYYQARRSGKKMQKITEEYEEGLKQQRPSADAMGNMAYNEHWQFLQRLRNLWLSLTIIFGGSVLPLIFLWLMLVMRKRK